jgi:hypothetical protein
MSLCAYIKPGGERCGSIAMKGYQHCYGHRPDLADERRRNASKGGRSGGRGRGSGELTEVKILLADLINRVLKTEGAEDIETGRAAVANQLINTRLRAIEVERKVKETDELLARLEELEAAQGKAELARNGARTWR